MNLLRQPLGERHSGKPAELGHRNCKPRRKGSKVETRASLHARCTQRSKSQRSVSSKGRQKAHKLYSDQPGKSPADLTVGAGKN